MPTTVLGLVTFAAACSALAGCESREPPKSTETSTVQAPVVQNAAAAPLAKAQAASPANVGGVAPDFALKDLDGKLIKLADFKGKTVVLEWFNPECPFVKASHTEGSLKGLADKYASNPSIVWLAINSGGEGRQGYGTETNKKGVESFGLEHPVLLDPDGTVGKAYGATNTPHMFIVDPKGVLVYAGAIDNSPDAEGQSPSGGVLVNYVRQALEELGQGKPISVPSTKAYGCSVKYQAS